MQPNKEMKKERKKESLADHIKQGDRFVINSQKFIVKRVNPQYAHLKWLPEDD